MIENADVSWEAIFNLPPEAHNYDDTRPWFRHPQADSEMEFTCSLLLSVSEIAGMAAMSSGDLDDEGVHDRVRQSVLAIEDLVDVLKVGLQESERRRGEE